MQPSVNIQSPINWSAPLNRGLLRWWLCLPGRNRGNVWRELTRRSDATVQSDAVARGSRGRPGGYGSWYGDGTDDRLSTPAMDFSSISTLTYSYWLNWTAYANDYDVVMSSSATGVSAGAIYNSPNAGDFPGTYIILIRTDASNWNGVSMARPSAAVWHHYTVCMDRNAGAQQVTAVYVDGVSQTLTQILTDTTSTSGFGNHAWVFLGFPTGGVTCGNGMMDDVRIYNRIPNASEALEFFRESKAGYPRLLRWLPELTFVEAEEEAVPPSLPSEPYPGYYSQLPRIRKRAGAGMACIKSASETVSSLNTAKPFTTIPGNAQMALVYVVGQAIHYRIDGGTPTSSVGTGVAATGTFYVTGRDNLENFRAIEDSASASLYVQYFDHLDG